MNCRVLKFALILAAVALAFPFGPAHAKLKITSDADSLRTSFEAELTAAAGKAVTISATSGLVSIAGPPPADNKFAERLRTVINDADTTTITITRNGTNILVGSYLLETIDLDDKEMLTGDGNDGAPTEAGGIIHEIWEQYQKQDKGKNYTDAHSSAIDVENEVMGGTERLCGAVATRTEDGKTVYYVPYKKQDGTSGYARIVMASATQIESVSFVTTVPAPSPPAVASLTSVAAIDTSYIGAVACAAPIPTLGEYAMTFLLLVLFIAGWYVMRRRGRSPVAL